VKYTTKLKTITFAFTIIVGLFSLVCTCHSWTAASRHP